jgi:hypothetical protein
MENYPHGKDILRDDIHYMRDALRFASQMITKNNWQQAREVFAEIAGIASNLEALTYENDLNIDGARYMDTRVIEEILAANNQEVAQ